MIKPDPALDFPQDLGKVHFVGIGGSGMSGIAHMFMDRGITVSGSDKADSGYLDRLRERGAKIFVEHDASNVGDADTLVVSSAIAKDNAELLRALDNGIRVWHRSDALAWLPGGQRLVAIAGAHGKTTSTGMVVTGLRGLGQDPSFVSGGVLKEFGTSSSTGAGDLFVIEADESDGSFQRYDVAVALITSVDPTHLENYTPEQYVEAFTTFAQNVRELVVASSDDKLTPRVLEQLVDKRVITFGKADHADVRIHDIRAGRTVDFALTYEGTEYRATLTVPGEHNAINAAGAFATLVGLGFDPADSLKQISAFAGTKRRFELKGIARGVEVYDDYAHEPAEVVAAVTGARSVVGTGRVIAVHQPHLYSRTKQRWAEFAKNYEELADYTIVLQVDGSREPYVEGVTGELVWNGFRDKSRVAYKPDWDDAVAEIARVARAGDIVMTLSCGTVSQIVPRLLEALENSEESGDDLASLPG